MVIEACYGIHSHFLHSLYKRERGPSKTSSSFARVFLRRGRKSLRLYFPKQDLSHLDPGKRVKRVMRQQLTIMLCTSLNPFRSLLGNFLFSHSLNLFFLFLSQHVLSTCVILFCVRRYPVSILSLFLPPKLLPSSFLRSVSIMTLSLSCLQDLREACTYFRVAIIRAVCFFLLAP